MRSEDFERQRRALEEQLERDLELVREAYRVKLRALEDLQSAAAGEEPEPSATAGLQKRPPRYLVENIVEVWDRLPIEFDKHDLYRVLGHRPPRATLDRVLNELLLSRWIVVHQASAGWYRTKYRKVFDEPA